MDTDVSNEHIFIVMSELTFIRSLVFIYTTV